MIALVVMSVQTPSKPINGSISASFTPFVPPSNSHSHRSIVIFLSVGRNLALCSYRPSEILESLTASSRVLEIHEHFS